MSSMQGSYLETEILTAPPQKLQLMMIEAAIRFSKRAQGHWQAGEDDLACEALIRAQRIVTELTTGLNREASPELVGKVASVYLFVFRRLMEANFEHDAEKLADAIRVLEVERETWRQVCDQVGRTPESENEAAVILPPLSTTPPETTPMPNLSVGSGSIDAVPRFSLEA